jgi:uncharacterized protein
VTPGELGILTASAFAAGVMNSMAGGGTLLTFPALLFLGESAISANATSTVALLPAAAASMAGYREEIAAHKEWLKRLLLPSIVGGAIGSLLLLETPEATFRRLVPILILFATLLLALQAVASRWARTRTESAASPARLAAASLLQLLVAVYGGYFGAGIGILMLVILGYLGVSDIHAMNGLKNFFGICINVAAALFFVLSGIVFWVPALVMMAAASAGGYAGARLARRMGQTGARVAAVGIGLGLGVSLFFLD